MFRFQHISHLYLLGLLPLLILLFASAVWWRRKKLGKLGDASLVSGQLLGFIHGRRALKFTLLALAFTTAVIGWANLQKGSGTEKVQRKGVDVIIALDVSKSMMARDIQPDRLTRAKQLIMSVLDKMQNDRVALIVFAGRAYLQVPLTIDYSAMKMMLQNVKPDLVPTQGTVISDAIDLASQSFSQKEKKFKSLVIISDGEDHDEQARIKASEAAEAGILIHTVGIGSPEGTTLFDPETKSVKLDENGSPVVSKLDENELKSIAAAGKGTYSLLRNIDDVSVKLVDEIDGMEQKSLGAVVFSSYSSYFQYFLVAAFLFLLIEWLIPGARLKPNSKSFPGMKFLMLFLFLGCSSVYAQKKQVKDGNKLYAEKKYKEAAAQYQQALKQNPNFTPGMFNLGNSLFQQKNYDGARQVLGSAAKQSKDKAVRADANYNIGNTYMQEQKWEEAINAYKSSLRNNPQDEAAKYNLSYAQAMMKKQQQQGGGKNDKQDNKDNKDQQNQNQNQQDQKDQQNKDQQNKDQQNQNQQDQKEQQDKRSQPQPSKLSEQQADQLLNALSQEEKKLHDKKEKGKPVQVKVEKDW